jgi:DNA-binding LytR/AlgR family response regulator
VLEALGSMVELEKDLSSYSCFIKPHRSYIINMDYIDIVGQKEIKMQSLTVVPLAKANYQLVKTAYIAYSFQ